MTTVADIRITTDGKGQLGVTLSQVKGSLINDILTGLSFALAIIYWKFESKAWESKEKFLENCSKILKDQLKIAKTQSKGVTVH